MHPKARFLPSLVCAAALALPQPGTGQNVRQSGRSDSGMVSAAHPLATEAGVRILDMGGNAADAAVATGFAIAIRRCATAKRGMISAAATPTAVGIEAQYPALDGSMPPLRRISGSQLFSP